MQLNEAVKRVKDKSHRGNVDVTTDAVTAQIIRAINDARREVISQLPKDWLRKEGTFVTVADTADYSLASDVQEPLLFRFTVNSATYVLERVPSEREFYLKYYDSSAATNKPEFYLDIGVDSTTGYRKIKLFPTPDAVYTITYPYYKDPTGTDLSTADLSTEIPDIPNHLHDVVWKIALAEFLKNFDDPAMAGASAIAEQAKMKVDKANNLDLDEDLQFRWDNQKLPLRNESGLRID